MLKGSKAMISIVIAIFSSQALASGMARNVFECQSTVNGHDYRLVEESTTAPGGPIHRQYKFSFGNGDTGYTYILEGSSLNLSGTDASILKLYPTGRSDRGHLDVVKINDKLFIGADLSHLSIPERRFHTSGLVDPEDNGSICSH